MQLSKVLLTLIFTVFSTLAIAFPTVPGHTTGHLCNTSDPDFYEYRYQEAIPYCTRNVATAFKHQIYDAYRVPKHCRHKYTIDHTIPLALGGSNSGANLWPEHKAIKALRQNLELSLYHQMLRGEITQREAVQTILWAKNNPPLDYIKLNPKDICDRL